MAKENWQNNMDDWLNDAMEGLPNPEVPSFESFEEKRKTGGQKKAALWSGAILGFIALISAFYNSNTEKAQYIPRVDFVFEEQTNDLELKEEVELNQKEKSKTSTYVEKAELAAENNHSITKQVDEPNHKPVTLKMVNSSVSSDNMTSKSANSDKELLPNADEHTMALSEIEQQNVALTIDNNIESIYLGNTLNSKSALWPNKSFDNEDLKSAFVEESKTEGLFNDEKFSITLSLYPNYTFRQLDIVGAHEQKVHKDYLEIVQSSEKGGMAVNIGADLKYKIGQDLFLGSGLYYIQTKITGSYNFEITEDPVVDSEGNITGYVPAPEGTVVNAGIVNSYAYLQMPLVLSYQPWVNKRLRMVVEGGTSYLRFLNAEGTTIDYQNLRTVDVSKMEYNKNLFTLNFKIGANYYITPQLAVGFEPTFLYFNNSIYADDYPINMVPWSIGVNFSLKIRLQ